ncbi:MAG TPA: autotransporter domain-containing protein [Rhodopila sp.]|nr:autotransporter domain-containing protein [Rhodopila sp.]
MLASVFGVAASGGLHAQTAYINSTSVFDGGTPPPPYTLGTGDSLTNTSSGTITVDSGPGAVIATGDPAAFVNNAGLIRFQSTGGGAAISVAPLGSISTITNAGTIFPNGLAGGTPDAIQVSGSVGTLLNQGAITSVAGDGVSVLTGGTITSLTNQNLISTAGVGAAAISNGGGAIGTMTNSGTISADGESFAGIYNLSGSAGTLVNTGLIQSTGANGAAIDNGGTIGALANAGVIQATGSGGNAIDNFGSIGAITNSGSILAPNGSAFNHDGLATGTLTNTQSGLISGMVAIDNTTGGRLTINNAGTIIGAIELGVGGDTLNVTGGTIAGAISGASGSGDTVNFNAATPYTIGRAITNIDTLSINSGAVVVAAPITGAMLFAVQQNATATLGAPVGATTFSNAGLVSLGSAISTINGNYVQTATGQLGVTVAGATAGQLNVSGTATIAGHPNALVVNLASTSNIVGHTYNVVSAGSLNVDNIGSLTLADNSLLVDFDASQIGNDLVLTAVAPSAADARTAANQLIFDTGLPAAQSAGLYGIGYSNAVSIGSALSGLLTYNIARGNQSLYDSLGHLSASQWDQVLSQLVPSFVGRAQTMLVTSMLSGGPWLGAVEHRLAAVRNSDGHVTGLAAGDDPTPGVGAWIQPYGGFASQDPQDGVSGYNASVYGVSLGADTAVRPDLRLGLAVQLGNADIRYTNVLQGNSDSIFTAQIGAYGTWRFTDHAFLDGQITYGHNSYGSTNYVTPLATTLKSNYGGNQFMARVGVGYLWTSGDLAITPLLSLQQYHFDIDSYNTSGGGAAGLDEHVNGQIINITQPRIGSSLSYRFVDQNGFTAIPDLHVYYMHNFGTDHLSITGNFIASGSGFQVVTPTFGKNIVDIGAGVTVMQKGPWSVTAAYDHADAGSARQDNFYLRVRTIF